jgi:hypothetical protein
MNAPNREDQFARAAAQRTPGTMHELLSFLAHNKKWWLAPIVMSLLLIGVLVVLGGTAVAPFIYTVF